MIKNKKGISEIVSYVLLIVIAVSISVLVYNFLVGYIPKGEVEECPSETSLIIENISCNHQGNVIITLTNKGYWNISNAYVRVGPPGSKVKSLLQPSRPLVVPLSPGNSITLPGMEIPRFDSGKDYELEVQPIVNSKKTGKPIACTKDIVSQTFNCR